MLRKGRGRDKFRKASSELEVSPGWRRGSWTIEGDSGICSAPSLTRLPSRVALKRHHHDSSTAPGRILEGFCAATSVVRGSIIVQYVARTPTRQCQECLDGTVTQPSGYRDRGSARACLLPNSLRSVAVVSSGTAHKGVFPIAEQYQFHHPSALPRYQR